MDNDARQQAEKLVHDLRVHNYRYYILNDPIISDNEYDILYQQFLEYEKMFPDLPNPIGSKVSGNTIVHRNKMLSLNSTHDLSNAEVTFISVKGEISCEPKIDGLAVELVYVDHVLQSASTRGDGDVGEDITANISLIDAIPKMIDLPGEIQIYGEVYLNKADLIRVNRSLLANSKVIYVNARNAAAGIARSVNKTMYLNMLSFFPYTIENSNFNTQCEFFSWADVQGFKVLSDYVSVVEYDDIAKYRDDMYRQKVAGLLPMEVDGLVFKFNMFRVQREIGMASRHPRWAIAYKFDADQAISRLIDVKFQVGKSGIIAPVGIISPVMIRGSEVRRASLANINKIREKDIRIYDDVVVEMANDVIPAIIAPIKDGRTGKELIINFPKHCPVCHQKLRFDSPHYRCVNPSCRGQVVGKLYTATGRRGFNIKGLGISMLEEMVDNNIISDISDVFKLDTDPESKRLLKEVLGYSDKELRKLFSAIDESRAIKFHKFVVALCIPDVSIGIAIRLAECYKSFDDMIWDIIDIGVPRWSNVNYRTLAKIDWWFGYGDTEHKNDNVKMIERLISRGVIVMNYENTTPVDTTVVFSGTLKMLRSDAEDLVRKAGGAIRSKMSSHVKYLIAGNNPSGTKVAYANRSGIKIITEQDFNNIFNP